jgi:hypothetical protein
VLDEADLIRFESIDRARGGEAEEFIGRAVELKAMRNSAKQELMRGERLALHLQHVGGLEWAALEVIEEGAAIHGFPVMT